MQLALAAAALASALLLGAMACAEPEQPTPTPAPATATPTPSPTPTATPTPTPTRDARTAIRDACADLQGDVPYDITYTSTISYSPSGETTPPTVMEVRINDRGDSHTVTRRDLSGDEDSGAALIEERIEVAGSTYVRDEPGGPWSQHPLFEREYSGGVLAARMCYASFEDIDADIDAFVHSILSADLAGPGPFEAVHSYTDLGRTMLNGAEVRHLQHGSRIELPSVTDLVPYVRFDEYWLTPEGLAQHRRMDTLANGIGETTVDALSVVSGVGEPNIIEAPVNVVEAPLPVLPTPAP